MVWGGIWLFWFKRTLRRCRRINQETYWNLLTKIKSRNWSKKWKTSNSFPTRYCKAPLGKTHYWRIEKEIRSSGELACLLPRLVTDRNGLGSSEEKMAGKKFKKRRRSILELKKEWDLLPSDTIQQLHGSFEARLQVCLEHNGECLNQFWYEVKKNHHRDQ